MSDTGHTGTTPEPAISESPMRDARAVVTRAIAASVRRLVEHEAAARLGEDPEGVHQQRVATRRLRSDLRTFAPLLERSWAESLRDALREVAADLGEVRDCDVLLLRLHELADLLPAGDDAGPVLDALGERRVQGRARLLDLLDSPAYAELLWRLQEAAAQPQFAKDADEVVLSVLARRPWRRLRRAVRHLGEHPADQALHAIRIDAKRARYAAEAVSRAVGREATEFARVVADIQGVLGDHHDAVVAAAWLRGLAPTLDPAAAFVAGELAGLELAASITLREQWRETWRKANRASLRRWMRG